MTEDDFIEYEPVSDDEDEPLTIYVCYCCNHTENERPAWGGQCPRCGAVMEEEII